MKVILIVLVFNFLKSCWPKVDIRANNLVSSKSEPNSKLIKKNLVHKICRSRSTKDQQT